MANKGLGNNLIIIVDNSVAITGALNAIRHATRPLQNQYEFEYVLPRGSAARVFLEKDGYRVHELPFVEISRRRNDLLLYIPMLLINGWRLYRLARHRGVNIIHLNDFYNLTGYIAKALSLGGLKVVTHVRFLPQSLPQPLARIWRWLGEHWADRVLCVSEAVRHYFGSDTKIQVVFDPIPVVERYPAPKILALRPNGTIQLLYLSNYIQGKGQDFALAAFQKAYARDSRLRLTFIGGDMGMEKNKKFREGLEATVRIAKLNSVVSFQGFTADVEKVIKEADMLLNFSESESFSLTCLDALYFGTPLIASDCGGPAELFENCISGLLVPNRDVEAMAKAITSLASDAAMRTRFAAAGRSFVRHKFGPDASFERLRLMYNQVLS